MTMMRPIRLFRGSKGEWWQFCAPGLTVTRCSPGYGAWFRVLGYGLAWTDTRTAWAPFSVRNGLTRSVRIGPLLFGVLRP